MSVRPPTLEELEEVAKSLNMTMSPAELKAHYDTLLPNFGAYDLLDALPDNVPVNNYPRDAGKAVDPDQNQYGAWYRQTSIKGKPGGILDGKKVVLKDNICLAGVPMMNGASTLEGYVPDHDATVVTRILDAGGEIVGKGHCEYFCLSGGSHTNAKGAVRNPYKETHSSGGSSSGCGALVGGGVVEMAIGCDQGGSIRIPSAWSGCVGMKPTWGLVPYTGIMPIESTVDFAGPITNNVSNNALLLEAIAGVDGLDPRQYDVRPEQYSQLLTGNISGLKIGVVSEGFSREESEPDSDALVMKAAQTFNKLGAKTNQISIPWHNIGGPIWLAIVLEGLTEQMMLRNGMGLNWKGSHNVGLMDAHASWRERADELSDSLKSCMLTGKYMLDKYRGRYYAKAQNLSRRLRAEYDKALSEYDILLMPTIPMKATPLPKEEAEIPQIVQRAFEMTGNTAPFDATGHPAISVPCGLSQGLPVGMMLIGKHNAEPTLYNAAYAFEQKRDWKKI